MDAVDQILEQWRQARPDLDVSAMGPIGRLSRVFHHHSRQMNETFARHGLNAAGFDVLATLRRAGPPFALSPGELMASMMITSGTMTNRIDQLIKQGLVTRAKDPGDARRAVVKLTKTGFDLIDQAVAAHVETQNTLLAALSDAEIAGLDEGLRKLLVAAEQDGGH
ncbi:MarR family winged helix-turn-helix transcriptional regulator [Pseudooceanicola sp. HF7]|uniref:MarR family winged helix-turn-helix transcriptional regulator n=1 Tax=Pseudooceanicola sp. HF7 TaxID=2721560 RepID=UPI00142FBA06|nr:MarR family transcriptional regulator [Pseudooceanicola sp. HF7]NIZ09790.1 MarR family transcriptional regulator [Pseudooceanicola sp. HF7]